MKPCPWCNTPDSFGNFPSESAKYLSLLEPMLPPSLNVIEVGSGGWPVVPHALQVELSVGEFEHYTSGQHRPPVQWRIPHANLMAGIGWELPFKDGVADILLSSHVIEDWPKEHTPTVLREWARVVKPGGHVIVLHPDRILWAEAIAKGQPPNMEHRAERLAGELGPIGEAVGLAILCDRRTECFPGDYGLITIFQKP